MQPPPLQPVKIAPAFAVAVSVTVVPPIELALQVTPQLIPAGFDVTVPVSVPFFVTVTVKSDMIELTALNAFSRRPVERLHSMQERTHPY